MKLSPARFVTINATEVMATPANADEAKIALKELRQKKKEFQLRRRALQAQAKTARAAAERAEGKTQRARPQRGFISVVRKLVGKAKARKPLQQLEQLEAELTATDEILFNIDSCAVQIEGRLLNGV